MVRIYYQHGKTRSSIDVLFKDARHANSYLLKQGVTVYWSEVLD